MVDISIKKQGNSVMSVKFQGHAGCGEAGEDIVCAGVSTLVNTTLLGLLQVAGVNVDYVADEDNAVVSFTRPTNLTVQENNDVDVILNTMLCGLYSMYEEYSDFINLEVS